MKMTVLSKLSKTMPRRIFRENSSFKSKDAETMSSKRINIKRVSFFIIKKKAA